jgi:hypothetical protein
MDEPQTYKDIFTTEDGARFAAQNDRLLHGLMPAGAPLPVDVVAAIDEYASHHAGGLMVLEGQVSPGVHVKVHDSWGDDTNIVVHVYSVQDDVMNGGLDMIQEFPISQAFHALRALDRLMGRMPVAADGLDDEA